MKARHPEAENVNLENIWGTYILKFLNIHIPNCRENYILFRTFALDLESWFVG